MNIRKNFVCPFCGGKHFSENTWSLESGEVDALECNSCYAGAPLSSWNKLYPSPITLDDWCEGQIDLVEVCNEK